MRDIKYLFLLLIIASPGFWWFIFQPARAVNEWSSAPGYISEKARQLTNPNLAYIYELRRVHEPTKPAVFYLSKLVYNRGTAYVNEFFSYASVFSPRYYFQSGDGGPLSAPGVEPIPILLFPFWWMGMVIAFRRMGYKPLAGFALVGFIAYLSGSSSIVFRFPVAVVILYFSSLGLSQTKPLWQSLTIILLIPYSLFLLTRALWI